MSSTRELEARKVGAVTANMSMSLDRHVEDPAGAGDVAEVFGWYAAGPREVEMPGDARSFRTSEASARHLEASVSATGALITGRRLFDLTKGWGGRHPAGC